jgi:hypothetical protein
VIQVVEPQGVGPSLTRTQQLARPRNSPNANNRALIDTGEHILSGIGDCNPINDSWH